MIVSWNWLKEYVELDMSVEELTERLTLTGLNLEGVEHVGDDVAIDLEVTSNRPDCLGHIGVAREISVLWNRELRPPKLELAEEFPKVEDLTSVTVQAPELCPRYTARVIRGVKIGPSPAWLVERLHSLGIAVINNVVDITNFVLFECGQPLHAFDFKKLLGPKIVVREALPGETFTAINHQEYKLQPGTCVIADAERAVALAGVMGGADTEVSDSTTDLLIEAADFDSLSVRTTARRLNLHSPSSYRFERGVDPLGIEWASQRCCQLILDLAGGELCKGVIDVGEPWQEHEPIKLRFPELLRVLGIEIAHVTVRKILTDLGCEETHACDHCVKVVPPSWRADLTREIDLVEEVARIHGYDQIPEDTGVKMVASTRSRDDRVIEQVRGVLVSAGFDEAMTLSTVEPKLVEAFRPWSSEPPLTTSTPVLRGANCLRQSLLPSLLTARRTNETLSNPTVELFEIASVYLPKQAEIPDQRRMLSITSGGGFLELKGVLELLAARIAPGTGLEALPIEDKFFVAGCGCQLKLGEAYLGYLGQVSKSGLEAFDLRHECSAAEIDLAILIEAAELIRQAGILSPYPPVGRDLNLVVDEDVRWSAVDQIVRICGGSLLENISFQEIYRDQQRLGEGKKSLLFSIQLRSSDGTLTNEQADEVRERIVTAAGRELGAELRA